MTTGVSQTEWMDQVISGDDSSGSSLSEPQPRNWHFSGEWVVESPGPRLYLWPADFAPMVSHLALSRWKEGPLP